MACEDHGDGAARGGWHDTQTMRSVEYDGDEKLTLLELVLRLEGEFRDLKKVSGTIRAPLALISTRGAAEGKERCQPPTLSRNGTPGGPTAAVERAHSDRAPSGSKGSAGVSLS